MTSLQQALETRPLVLDGGLATQLEAQGADLASSLWSARLLRDEPEQITTAHRAFLQAGAQIIETATYQASFEGFARHGISRDEAVELMSRGGALARAAVATDPSAATEQRFVAASAGPYGAMLADGSEYTGAYDLSVDDLRRFHEPRLEVLASSDVDVIAVETIPNLAELTAIARASAELAVPVWISVSVEGDALRSGESLREAFHIAASHDNVIAVGINCSTSHDVTLALPLAASFGKPVVVYPNSGEGWDATARHWTGTGDFEPMLVSQWVEQGAQVIGGCCRVTPAQIAGIAQVLAS